MKRGTMDIASFYQFWKNQVILVRIQLEWFIPVDILLLSIKREQKVHQYYFLNGTTPASYPDVSLLMKMCAQRKAGRIQGARRLADLVFKMVARVMADEYAIFKISSALFILRI